MSVFLEKPQHRRDWGAFAFKLGLAVLEGGSLNFAGALSNFDDAVRNTLEAPTNGQRAWLWLYTSLAAALKRLSTTLDPNGTLDQQELGEAIRAFAAEVLDAAECAEISAVDLENPADSQPLAPLTADVPEMFKPLAEAQGQSADKLRQTFRMMLRRASVDVLSLYGDDYRPLIELLTGTAAHGVSRDRAWARHATWIRGKFERDPIFAVEEDQDFPLAAIYQRLRCYWHEDVPEEDTEEEHQRHGRDRRMRRIAHVADLHGRMDAWLDDPGGSALRLVTGGPGSGKSSFSRAFAVETADRTGWRVVFVELQHLNFEGQDLETALRAHLTSATRHSERDPGGSAGFPESPLDWRSDSDDPILLIFDGLDELSADPAAATELTAGFAQSVNRYLAQAVGGAPVRAVILGRAAACEEARGRLNLPLADLIHVAKLAPLGPNDLQMQREESVTDPDGLCGADERETYWQRWAAITCQPQDVPEAVKAEALAELNVEPLLLHLLILSGYTGANWQQAVENRNRVYREIFDRVLDRNAKKQKEAGTRVFPVEDAFTALECLGLAAWRGGGRTGEDTDFQRLIGRYAPQVAGAFDSDDMLSLRNVALQFYTRQGEATGYEFIHKSFSEYLTARALVQIGLDCADDLTGRRPTPPETAALLWTDLIGSAELTDEVMRFLIDEARLQPLDVIPAAKTALTGLFSWVQAHGMPVTGAGHTSFRAAETAQRCAETALLAVLSALARALPAPEGADEGDPPPNRIDVDWPRLSAPAADFTDYRGRTMRVAPRMMLQRLWHGQSPSVRKALAGLDLSHAWLLSMWLGDADLSGANLDRAHLSLTNLVDADLSGANLGDATVVNANLIAANLCNADLSGADLYGAKLGDADLRGAILHSAKLQNANLIGAELSGADCNRMQTMDAALQSADLSGAKNLTQDQVNVAKGSKVTTKLPEGLVAPDHWDED